MWSDFVLGKLFIAKIRFIQNILRKRYLLRLYPVRVIFRDIITAGTQNIYLL